MKSNKRMQALLSTAMCAAILFSNAAAVFAAEDVYKRQAGVLFQLAVQQ